MMGFDTYQGLPIILIIPLLFWYQKSRMRVKRVELSIFPLLDLTRQRPSGTPSRIPRLNQRWRFFLLSAALLSLMFAFNGLHIVNMIDHPGEWLVILDNPLSSLASPKGKTVHSIGIDGLEIFTRDLNSRDTYTLLSAAPANELIPGLGRKELLSIAAGTLPALPYPRVSDMLGVVNRLSEGIPFKGAILISPRTHRWREELDRQSSTVQMVMAEGPIESGGNAGIVAFDVFPASPGFFDLFLRIASDGLKEGHVTVRFSQGVDRAWTATIPLELDGSARIELESIPLNPGEFLVELLTDDLLDLDNSVTAHITQGTEPLFVDFGKRTSRFLQSAVLADKRVISISSDPGETPGKTLKIIDGRAPDQGDTGPALVIFPTEDFWGFSFQRLWTSPRTASFNPVHPLTRNIRFRDFRPAKIAEFSVPGNFQILMEAEGIPLIAAGEGDQGRVVFWGFDPEDNGLYLDPSFPILVHESVRWLSEDRSEASYNDQGCLDVYKAGTGERERVNILCQELTVESGKITLPYLPRIEPSNLPGKIPVRTELAPYCIVLAMIILILLAVNSALDRKDD